MELKTYKQQRHEQRQIVIAYEDNANAEQFSHILNSFIQQHLNNAKVNVVEVGKNLYNVGFEEGFNSGFFNEFLSTKLIITNNVQTNPLVAHKSFFAAMAKYFNLEICIDIYDQTDVTKLVVSGFEPDNVANFTTQDYQYSNRITACKKLQTLKQCYTALPEFMVEFQDAPATLADKLAQGRVLLGEEYAMLLLPDIPHITAQDFSGRIILKPQLLQTWQTLLYQVNAHTSNTMQSIIACDIYLYIDNNLENLIDELLELNTLLASEIKLLEIRHRGQRIFPYDNTLYRDHINKPRGEFCLRFIKPQHKAMTYQDISFLLQQLFQLGCAYNKIEFLRDNHSE